MKRVVVLDDYQGRAHELANWSSLGPDIEITYLRDHVEGEDLVRVLQGAEIVVAMRERTRLPKEVLHMLPNLRCIATSGMGNTAIDLAAAADLGIVVTGARANSKTTVEFAWGMIFAVTKHIVREDRSMRAGKWQETLNIDLEGATLAIAGLGKIGTAMVPMAQLLGMRVIAWSQNLDHAYATSLGVEALTKSAFLEQADVLTIHLALSDRTRGVFASEDLHRMRSNAYLVNTSRGPIVDEKALIHVLEHRHIAGAALDVFDREPITPGHPYLQLDNVVLTPHLGYASETRMRTFYAGMLEGVASYLDGAPINIIVAPEH